MKLNLRKPQTSWLLAAALILTALIFTTPAFAIAPGHAIYVRGSIAKEPSETTGAFDFNKPDVLTFKTTSAATSIAIPYSSIEHFEYHDDVAHHLGFFPAMFVGMFAPRERRYLFTITWHDASDVSQVIVFEVPKQDPAFLLPLLQRRTSACGDNKDACGRAPQPVHHDF